MVFFYWHERHSSLFTVVPCGLQLHFSHGHTPVLSECPLTLQWQLQKQSLHLLIFTLTVVTSTYAVFISMKTPLTVTFVMAVFTFFCHKLTLFVKFIILVYDPSRNFSKESFNFYHHFYSPQFYRRTYQYLLFSTYQCLLHSIHWFALSNQGFHSSL